MVKPVESSSIPTSAPAAGGAQTTATVQKGETFTKFALRNNVSEQDLQKSNPKVDPAKIQQGQELVLPQRDAKKPETKGSPAQAETSKISPQIKHALLTEHSLKGDVTKAALVTKFDSPVGGPSGPMTTGGGLTLELGQVVMIPNTLKHGSKGPEVQDLQKQVNNWRTQNGKSQIGEDGKFGDITEKAIKDFQKANNLKQDGTAGPRTRDRLTLESDANFQKVDPKVQQQIRTDMEKASTHAKGTPDSVENQPTRTNLVNIGTDPNFAKLSPEGQDLALKRLQTNPSDLEHGQKVKEGIQDRANLENDPNFKKLPADTQKKALEKMETFHDKPTERANLTKLMTDPKFAQLPAATQEKALQTFAKNPANTAFTESMQKMMQHDRFIGMSPADQGRMLNVFGNTTPKGADALYNLMNRDIGGTPALTSRGYKNTGTLLENLDRAATTPLDTRLAGTNTAQFTENLLNEVSDPSHYIDQSSKNTCTVTSMGYQLAAKNPAEYARIATDLATTGQSKLANGSTIQPPADAWAAGTGTRSDSERLMQSALMNYARPTAGYTNTADAYNDGRSGLDAAAEERVLEGLHGRDYDTLKTFSMMQGHDMVMITQNELKNGRGPVYTGVKWGGGAHAICVTEIRDGRVYFRNPWGGDQAGINTDVGPNGTTRTNPNVRTDDARNGIQSMTIDEYRKHIMDVHILD